MSYPELPPVALCAKLYKLSGWQGTIFCYQKYVNWDSQEVTYEIERLRALTRHNAIPAYDLGFMRKKLFNSPAGRNGLLIQDIKTALLRGEKSTCELIIRLFEEGILKNEQ